MKVSDKLIGKICRNQDGREGLVTCIKGDEVRGIGLDGKGKWSSNNPRVVKDHDYEVAICQNGRVAIIPSWEYNDIRGIGIDGKPWKSSNAAELVERGGIETTDKASWNLVRNILKG